jgi:hypothetical protein
MSFFLKPMRKGLAQAFATQGNAFLIQVTCRHLDPFLVLSHAFAFLAARYYSL